MYLLRNIQLAWLLLLMTMFAGCAINPLQPINVAKTTEQRAYAAYGLFTIAEVRGANLIASPDVPDSIKKAIKSVDATAKPIADEAAKTTVELSRLIDDYENQTTSNERMIWLTNHIDELIGKLTPLTQRLQALTKR